MALFSMRMSWHDLLFAHAPVPTAALRALVPAALELDTFDGVAWLGVVPFRMTRVGPRWLPPLPGVSAFPELNVRTYVTHAGRPGVWFFSLDAADPIAVRVARTFFHLPYYDAAMSCDPDPLAAGDGIAYRSTRIHRHAPPASLTVRYRPTAPPTRTRPGSLDHWLTERYCLYAIDRRSRLRRCDIAHEPWPLQPAAADFTDNSMVAPLGLPFPPTPPLLHFARRLDVTAGPLLLLD